MEKWIDKLDPNVVIPIIGVGLTWLWHRMRGQKTTSLRDILDAAITTAVHRLLADPQALGKARDRLTAYAYEAMERHGLPRNAWSEALVKLAVEEGMAELSDKLHELELAEIAAGAQRTADSFVPPKRPGVPKLDLDIEEVTSPEGQR